MVLARWIALCLDVKGWMSCFMNISAWCNIPWSTSSGTSLAGSSLLLLCWAIWGAIASSFLIRWIHIWNRLLANPVDNWNLKGTPSTNSAILNRSITIQNYCSNVSFLDGPGLFYCSTGISELRDSSSVCLLRCQYYIQWAFSLKVLNTSWNISDSDKPVSTLTSLSQMSWQNWKLSTATWTVKLFCRYSPSLVFCGTVSILLKDSFDDEVVLLMYHFFFGDLWILPLVFNEYIILEKC